MAERPRVVLLIEESAHYGRQILSGVARYVRTHQPWEIFLEQQPLGKMLPPWMLRRDCHGVISRQTNRSLAKLFHEMKVSVVDLSDREADFGFPKITSNDRNIGEIAAKHFLDRGIKRFAYFGYKKEMWSDRRLEGFSDYVEAEGYECNAYTTVWFDRHSGHMSEWDEERWRIAEWIRSLKKPVGILMCGDTCGQHVIDACHRADAVIPEEVLIMGVGDELETCELCDPPLSSVIPNPEKIGYEAAATLDLMLQGEIVEPEEVQIDPLGIMERQSTNVVAIEDPDIATALKFIQEHACEGITVSQVLKQVPLSRSLLERRFRKYLRKSPQEVIREEQLKRVKQLLTETDFPLEHIAELAGYKHYEYMSVIFKRHLLETPGQYRRKTRFEK
ncbi:MAG: DNA-binding transcriptional regulator [Candidatus Omnitrophica bacterium]|nr:DNA-binding transcriptional regulator [Candidatus Omnitrophota bacterium]